jgi:cobalamin biosynthesis protein CobT
MPSSQERAIEEQAPPAQQDESLGEAALEAESGEDTQESETHETAAGEEDTEEEDSDGDESEEEEDGEESGDDNPGDRAPARNSAASRCIRAWNRAYHRKLDQLGKNTDDYRAQSAGKEAFLRQLPPLAGFKNVRDFVACIAYGEAVDILSHSEVRNFLESAQVALAVLRQADTRRARKSKRRGPPSGEN